MSLYGGKEKDKNRLIKAIITMGVGGNSCIY